MGTLIGGAIGGHGDINWGCTSTMEGISPNLLREMDFKWAVVIGEVIVFAKAKVSGFYTAISLGFFWSVATWT